MQLWRMHSHHVSFFFLDSTFQQTFELPEAPKEDSIRIIPGKPAPKVQISFD